MLMQRMSDRASATARKGAAASAAGSSSSSSSSSSAAAAAALGRASSTGSAAAAAAAAAKKKPTLTSFLERRDYSGALALLEFELRFGFDDDPSSSAAAAAGGAATGSADPERRDTNVLHMWVGYCAFHNGMFTRALEAYEAVSTNPSAPQSLKAEATLCTACLHLYMQEWTRAEELAKSSSAMLAALQQARGKAGAQSGPLAPSANESALASLSARLLMHAAHRLSDESKLLSYHKRLTDAKPDQLSVAAVHFLRGHHQQATDVYKRLLLESREDAALNVYIAMCYFKMDYYDVSLEVLAAYLQQHRDSPAAINLKACNHFRLYNGKAAEQELRALSDAGFNTSDHPLLRHNLVVFRGGQNALQVLPSLVGLMPEARLNLVIYYLRSGDVQEAFSAMQDVEPVSPPEYVLKGVVNAALGQSQGSREHLQTAQEMFQLVGSSTSECDTIPGRQCMASCFFLLRQFEDVNVYLSSIKTYLYNDDDFNWNYGISLAATGQFKEAEECLLLVQNEKYRAEYVFLSWLTRCHIMNNKPRLAWDLYLKMDTSSESFNLLQLIANDCYRTGHFYYAAKAFDILERLDPDPEYWEGKRGACIGVFQQVVAARLKQGQAISTVDNLKDVLVMLRNTSNPQVEYISRIIRKWCADNGIKVQ